LAALVRAVELCIVQKRAPIIANNGVGGHGLGPRTRLKNLVLQSAGQGHHAFFGLVSFQKCQTLLLVSLSRDLREFLLLLTDVILQLSQDVVHFLFRK
jgi:hypothetical protein